MSKTFDNPCKSSFFWPVLLLSSECRYGILTKNHRRSNIAEGVLSVTVFLFLANDRKNDWNISFSAKLSVAIWATNFINESPAPGLLVFSMYSGRCKPSAKKMNFPATLFFRRICDIDKNVSFQKTGNLMAHGN